MHSVKYELIYKEIRLVKQMWVHQTKLFATLFTECLLKCTVHLRLMIIVETFKGGIFLKKCQIFAIQVNGTGILSFGMPPVPIITQPPLPPSTLHLFVC